MRDKAEDAEYEERGHARHRRGSDQHGHCQPDPFREEEHPGDKKIGNASAIAPGIIVTPLAINEFNGPRGGFYKNMFAKCPAGRPCMADEAANAAKLLMSGKGTFITGSAFLIGGGAASSYYCGPLQP